MTESFRSRYGTFRSGAMYAGQWVVVGLLVLALVVVAIRESDRKGKAKISYNACYDAVLGAWVQEGHDDLQRKQRKWLTDEHLFEFGTPEELRWAKDQGIDIEWAVQELEERARHAKIVGITPDDLFSVDRRIRDRCGKRP